MRRQHGQQAHNKRNKYILVFAIAAILIVAFFIVRLLTFYSRISGDGEKWGGLIPKERTTFTILLMGYGGPGHEGAYLTDTMMLARIDTEKKKVLLISIPRDIWIQLPTQSGKEFSSKINASYQAGLFRDKYPDIRGEYTGEEGAARLVKKVVGDIVGFEVEQIIAIDFDGFKQAVDTLGGVDVNVEKPFTDYEYPVTGKEDDLCGVSPDDTAKLEELEKIATDSPNLAYPCRYKVLNFEAGTQHMSGETALKFVRSRHSAQDGGDFNRARRQQLFLQAVKGKVLNISFLPKILPLLDSLENNIRTDIPLELTQKLLKQAPNSSEYEIHQIVLDTDNYLVNDVSADRQYILSSKDGEGNWQTLQKDIQNYINDISPTPSIPQQPKVTKKAFKY
jgi:anionic cell wall polymer biosynthesis LytR-Cps2A-Psr (LCP) family protein